MDNEDSGELFFVEEDVNENAIPSADGMLLNCNENDIITAIKVISLLGSDIQNFQSCSHPLARLVCYFIICFDFHP